jgi:hypothetical protein
MGVLGLPLDTGTRIRASHLAMSFPQFFGFPANGNLL